MQRTLKSDLSDPVFLQGAAAGIVVLTLARKIFRRKKS